MKKINLPFITATGWFAISLVLLTLPGSSFPKEDLFDKIWFDKWIHVGIFSILSALWGRAIQQKNHDNSRLKTIFIIIGLACLAYGIIMEFVQKYWVPNRSFDAGDIVADGVGAIAGVIYCISRYIKK